MELKTQIISLTFSFVFGIVFSIFTNLNYRFLFCKNKVFKIIITIVYVIDAALLYFLILKKINNGVIHSYFLLLIAVGFLIGSINFIKYVDMFKQKIKNVFKKCQKK